MRLCVCAFLITHIFVPCRLEHIIMCYYIFLIPFVQKNTSKYSTIYSVTRSLEGNFGKTIIETLDCTYSMRYI